MARVEALSDSQRSFVTRLTEKKATPFQAGQLDALRMSVTDPTDRRLVEQALELANQREGT